MDIAIMDFFSSVYIYCYQRLLEVNIALPPPERAFETARSMGDYLLEHMPQSIYQTYQRLVTVPLQANIVPVFLAIVVLYMLFSLVMWCIRAIFRLIYGFLRFSILVVMTATLMYVTQQYVSDGMPFMEYMLDTLTQIVWSPQLPK
ncbi:hypothetical protein BDF14DRAFT_1844340 [Spinellus fusiger]|nr:hypothetical protein BDF14DRAFT_1844340 [Spinellus fusiger]